MIVRTTLLYSLTFVTLFMWVTLTFMWKYSGEVLRISPTDSNFSWNVLSLDGDNIVAGNIKSYIYCN